VKRILLGIAVGAALGFVYVLLPLGNPFGFGPQNSASDSNAQNPDFLTPPGSDGASASNAPSAASTPQSEASENRATIQTDPQRSATEADSRAAATAPAPLSNAVASYPPMRVALPVEIQSLLEGNENLSVILDQFESQPIDPIWAPTTETQILILFSKSVGVLRQFGTPTVNCRSTMCEIHAVANGSAVTDWRLPMMLVMRAPWAADLSIAGLAGANHETEGSTLFFVRRRNTGQN
jgi:hypothetical protein